MIIIRPKILQKRPVGVSRDQWRVIQRESMRAMVEHWRKHFLRDHFEPNAKHKYKHRPRSKAYRARKEKLAERGKVQGGGLIDNVFSGRSRDAFFSNPAIGRAYPTRYTIRLQGPPYFTIRFKGKSNQPNKPREIATITEDERKVLAKAARDTATELIKRARAGQQVITP